MITANAVPQREILWNVAPAVMTLVYVVSFLCIAWIVAWFLRRARRWNGGRRTDPTPRLLVGIKKLAVDLLTHRTLRRDPYARLMHALIFWGFVNLLIATTLVGIQHHTQINFLTGTTYLVFSLAADLGGLAFCAGILMAIWRRRTNASHGRLLPAESTNWMLYLLLLLGVSGFLVEGARIARDFPAFEIWSPVGYATAKILASIGIQRETATRAHEISWIVHALLVMAFFVVVPLTLLRHIIVAAYSVARSTAQSGVLQPSPTAITSAVGLAQFRRLDLLQADACLTCGMCTEVCPGQAAGKPLSPRSVVLGLRSHLDRPDVPLAVQVEDDALWSCTTCNACDAICPAGIDIVDKIVMMRRGRVAEGTIPWTAALALESAAQKFNPFDHANSTRLDWASGLNVPVASKAEPIQLLYWIGCAGAFDRDGRQVARAMVQILNRLHVDYRVLGHAERCTGDPARRLGEDELCNELARTNLQTLADHDVQTILTHCPHCFHTFQNEYPRLGTVPKVIHHSQWLSDQIADGALKPRSTLNEHVTFHDPCYLARTNHVIDSPRDVLDAMLDDRRIEMASHGENSFCCGGGGGQLWLDVPGQTRVETIRAAHVEHSGAQTVATACPFCRVMLESGRRGLADGQGNWRVQDIAELIVENFDSTDC